MKLTRRAFLILTGACAFEWPALPKHAFDAVLVDEALRARHAFDASARVTLLTGDALWLWHTHLSQRHTIAGLTRPADAFVFAQLAMTSGRRATQRALSDDAVLWTLE